MRSNYAYGTVGSATWTSQNGSKLGTCNWPGFSGTAFEPRDEYKGDFARTYFYMSTRYYTEDSGWSSSDMTIKSQLKPWALQMMLHWSTVDPVSQKETDRNNTVYGFQNNRNPFIDHPEYASMIWGNPVGTDELKDGNQIVHAYPNPAVDFCRVTIPEGQPLTNPKVNIISLSGSLTEPGFTLEGNSMEIDIRILPAGFYMIQISDQTCNYRARLMKIN
jgi:hypothetical protein